MAQVEIIGLQSTLAVFQGTFTSGDTVLNSSQGLLVLCLGELSADVGDAKTVVEKDGSEITILPGGVSEAITVAAGEALFVKNTRPSMSGTTDATMAFADLA